MTIHRAEDLPGYERLRHRFTERLIERHNRLAAIHAEMQAGRLDRAALRAAQDELHKIGGAAGSIGFTDLGREALRTEQFFLAQIEGRLIEVTILLQSLGAFLEQSAVLCRAHLERIEAEREAG